MDTLLSETIDDCETDEFVPIILKNEDVVNRYNLRYYLSEENTLKLFKAEEHYSDIGKEFLFRSPIKCKCADGKICRKCYGELTSINKDIHIGIEAVLELTERFTQTLLSAKHLQQVSISVVEWTQQFLDNFVIDKGTVYLDTEKEKSGSSLIIADDDIELDEEEGVLNIFQFTIKSKNGNESLIELPMTLTLTEGTKDLYQNNPIRDKDNRIVISFKNLAELEDGVFVFNLENNELSTSLQAIINLIEKDHLGLTNIDEITVKFIDLLNDGRIELNAVHVELILRNLVRDINDYTKRPKRFDDESKYEVLKVSDAIFNSSSPAVSLSFEHIKKQFQSPDLYLKEGTSILDSLFF